MKIEKITCLIAVVMLLLVSCTTSKQMVYMNDLKADSSITSELLKARASFESKIQKNDLLWINVGGPNSADLVALNSALGMPTQGGAGVLSQAGSQVVGYLVEADGSIKVPYVGKVKAEGLTRLELEEILTKEFTAYTKDPTVNVRFMNYKITVIGDVARPGTFSMPNERVTILEALGLAGDLTVMGKRESVLVIREVNGERTIGRVNLLSKDLFTSSFYYLNTNDVVYVEPAPAKFFARERLPQFISLAAGSLSLLAIILSLRN
ncbi:polysaccharide biosynthesis/export family protein [Flavihumibacter cheonanensis]|uniref:polysaccharide biosynthesis/export family protein n=1 Tax=Flavihumibacter cheonanensis TaxID=1442385 RepID=UPI001EF99621|nr:polysaccharide biosynthesis/export family protein [Flavihumibacter cheonanensis]MCG7753894.1 polysaccharide biosynthesis/export family protein [Flavihumibacter cheonanensis]